MAQIEIEQLVNLFRKRFAIPNLIIGVGILFFLVKMLSIWFSSTKVPEVKLADINPAKESTFLLKRNISLSDYEIVPKKNLFRSSRAEWVPLSPPPKPKPKPKAKPKAKPTPPPVIKISGIFGGGISSKRVILEGTYFTPVVFEKKTIKKKGYKLYDMIGQYRINKINHDKVALMDPNGKSYEFYMDKNKAKRKEALNKPIKLKGEKLLGTAIKK